MPTTVELVADGTSGSIELEQHLAKLMGESFDLFKRKNAAYGTNNISICGERGLVVRILDKAMRLYTLVWQGKNNPVLDEGIEDTFIDIHNYCLYALLVRRNLWPDMVFKANQ